MWKIIYNEILISRIYNSVNDLVKNPVYGSSDIPMSSATENPVTTSQPQPTYQGLVTDNGKL